MLVSILVGLMESSGPSIMMPMLPLGTSMPSIWTYRDAYGGNYSTHLEQQL